MRIDILLDLFAVQAEDDLSAPSAFTGYSVAVGEFSGDEVEGKSIKYGVTQQCKYYSRSKHKPKSFAVFYMIIELEMSSLQEFRAVYFPS